MPDRIASPAPSVPLRVKRLDKDLPLPVRAHPGDAGVDLYSTTDAELAPGRRQLVGTGIAVALPHGTVGLIHPRSGLAARAGLSIVNTPGTIDAGYRGEIIAQRAKDGYINATAMCKAAGKAFAAGHEASPRMIQEGSTVASA